MLVFSVFIMLIIAFFTGIAVQHLLRQSFSFTHAVMIGFLSLLATFHIIAYPMICLNTSFSLLFWSYSAILLFFVVFAFYVLSSKGVYTSYIQNLRELGFHIRSEFLLLLVAVGVAIYFLFVSMGYSYVTSDDSYYLPRAMEILAQNQLGISHGFGWTGLSATSFPNTVDASTLEAWKAYWSYLFQLNPTVFCRNTLTVVTHFVSWCALYHAYQSISRHPKGNLSAKVFFIVYLLMILVDNRLPGTTAFWTLRYPSQGKSMLISIIYPALIYCCCQIVSCGKNHIPWQKWFCLSLVFTAGVATTIVGVFWPFLCCLTMGIPYLLLERRKDLNKLLLPLFLTCLPIIIYAGISYLSVATEQTHYFQMESPNWSQALSSGLNINRLDLLLICLVFTFTFGSKNAKLVIAGGCVLLFATFANPLFVGFVSKYLTTGSVYFRLFWMIPIYFLVAYTVAELFGSITLKKRHVSMLVLTVILISSVGFGALRVGPQTLYHRFNEKLNINWGSEFRTNAYGLPEFWYELTNKLLEGTRNDERIRVMWLSDRESFLRQYSERIELVGACRSTQWVYFDQPLEEGSVTPLALREDFVLDGRQDFSDRDWAYTQLVASKINYLCVDSSSGFASEGVIPPGFELFSTHGSLIVYRITT